MEFGFIIGGCLTFSAYCLVSFIFRKNPLLLHRKKDIKFRARHISHRGGAGENLENTMSAFRHAMNVGTDMLEIDVHLTRDGVVVISHDNDLFRVTGQRCVIQQTNYVDLPPLREHLPCQFGDNVVRGFDRRIPTLRELFELCQDLPINIDIKIDDEQLIEKVSELVKEFNRQDITVWGNFREQIVKKCHAHNPNIHTLFSMRGVLQLSVLYMFGLLPFIPLRDSFYEVLLPSAFLKHNVYETYGLKARIIAFLVEHSVLNTNMMKHLQARGCQVYIWVLNRDEEFDTAVQLGADGIMTDFPSRLRDWLDRQPIDRFDNKQKNC